MSLYTAIKVKHTRTPTLIIKIISSPWTSIFNIIGQASMQNLQMQCIEQKKPSLEKKSQLHIIMQSQCR